MDRNHGISVNGTGYAPRGKRRIAIGVGNLRLTAASISFRRANIHEWAGMTGDKAIQSAVVKLMSAVDELSGAIIQHDKEKGADSE